MSSNRRGFMKQLAGSLASPLAAGVARAALARHETRGSHTRTDFPELVARERHRSYVSLRDLDLAVPGV